MLNIVFAKSLVVFSLIAAINGHKFGFGDCPRVDNVDNLDTSNIADTLKGQWYVLAQTATMNDCFTYNMTKLDDATMTWYKYRSVKFIADIGASNTIGVKGDALITDTLIQVDWPYGTRDVIIFYVSGDSTVIGMYDCYERLGFMHFKSAAVLSRKEKIPDEQLIEVQSTLQQYTSLSMDIISHKDCATEKTLNFNIDDDLLGDGISDVVQVVQQGVNAVG